jgi:hypothetical protein
MTSEARGIAIGFIVITLAAVFLYWYHEQYVPACVESGHTKQYCEMEFWK